MQGTADTSASDPDTAYRDKFAVVGAGVCGLAIAAAFKRRGIAFDALEADDDIGGNWYHGVYETVHIISSRKTTEFPDYPMPASYPDFPSAAQMLAYLRDYADHFELRPHIELNTPVAQVRPSTDRTTEDLWEVELEDGTVRLYRGVVVVNGHHWDTRMPQYPGTFAGELIHSKDYKRPEQLTGKRVLVIGGGNSACDIAVEAARFGASSHISLRRGYWFLPKTLFGVPSIELIKPWLPVFAQRILIRGLVRIAVGRYENYGLQHPDHAIFEHHPTINSQLLYYIKHGRITPHRDIERWDGETVVFQDGTRETFDLVIAATGFHVSLPMVAPGVIDWNDGYPNLVNGVVHPVRRNFFAFGMGQARYGIGPLVTAGADLLCDMIETQKRLRHPLGAVLERIGGKPPDTWIADPMAILRKIRIGKLVVPKLPRVERLLM
jgi:hypothetical protein